MCLMCGGIVCCLCRIYGRFVNVCIIVCLWCSSGSMCVVWCYVVVVGYLSYVVYIVLCVVVCVCVGWLCCVDG